MNISPASQPRQSPQTARTQYSRNLWPPCTRTTQKAVRWHSTPRKTASPPRYFSRIVKDKTGRTAQEWISAVVIDEARRLLEDPENSIKDVAFKLGFPNQSFFGRYFLKYYGQLPSAYRTASLEKGTSL